MLKKIALDATTCVFAAEKSFIRIPLLRHEILIKADGLPPYETLLSQTAEVLLVFLRVCA